MTYGQLVRYDAEFQQLMEQLKRVARITAQFPIDVQKNDDAYHIVWVPQPPMLVRITGHACDGTDDGGDGGDSSTTGGSWSSWGDSWGESWGALPSFGPGESGSGSSGGYCTLPQNHYKGIQQIINVGDDMSQDNNSGVQFHSGFPLIEVNGVTTVPENTVVYATPAIQGTHYEFVFGSGTRLQPCDQSGSGSGDACCPLRLEDIFRREGEECEVADGCFRIIDENGDPVNLFLDFVFDT